MAYTIYTSPTAAMTNAVVWCQWATNCTTDSTASSSDVWQHWTEGTASTSDTTACRVWIRWTSNTPQYIPSQVRQQTPEEIAERQRVAAELTATYEKQRKEREAKEAAANARAEELLKSHLSDSQRKQYETEKRFTVTSQRGKCYEIRPGWGHNVDRIRDDGKHDRRFCLVHRHQVPIPDLMLTQKLMLETDEDEFLRIANASELIAA